MAPKLTDEQREAIRQRDAVKIEDAETRKVYFIVDGDLHDRAMHALAEHETRRAIQAGIDDLTAGRVVSFSEIDSRLRAKVRTSCPRMTATYAVVLTEQAARDLEAAAEWWGTHRSMQEAGRWYKGFSATIESLQHTPERCPAADESGEFPYKLRELHFGLGVGPTHRAVYTIVGEFVVVLTIRHEAQRAIRPSDLTGDI